MDKRATIISFRRASDSAACELDELIAQYDEFLGDWPPLLFHGMNGGIFDPDQKNDHLIFIDSGCYMIDGDGDSITVAVSREPLSLARLLENGAFPTPGCELPLLRDVEILLVGDIGTITPVRELTQLGIYLDSFNRLTLDESWSRTGTGSAPHFNTEIWNRNDGRLTLETTMKAARLSQLSYGRSE